MSGNPDTVQQVVPTRWNLPNSSVQADLVWTAELHRRQDAHTSEVWQQLQALPRDTLVTLTYAPDQEATGAIQHLDGDLAQIRLAATWTRWIPLLQVEAIDGDELPTNSRLESPQTASVTVIELARGGP